MKLNKIKDAPKSGWMLLYLRNQVKFQPYSSVQEVEDMTGEQEILELHLFDKSKEYRAISTESKRFKDGVIEHIADFADDENRVYRQKTLLEDGSALTVLNLLRFDERGMAVIDDYRLVYEEVK